MTAWFLTRGHSLPAPCRHSLQHHAACSAWHMLNYVTSLHVSWTVDMQHVHMGVNTVGSGHMERLQEC